MKKLVLYYSQARGNTKRIAEMISKELDADIEQINTVVPYTGTYQQIVDQGQDEVNRGYMPEVYSLIHNLNEYDEIIIGTPTWWYTMAPAVLTFLTKSKLIGKRVALFQTHGGWPGHTLSDMKKVCEGAEVYSEYAIQFDSTGGDCLETNEADIRSWIKTL